MNDILCLKFSIEPVIGFLAMPGWVCNFQSDQLFDSPCEICHNLMRTPQISSDFVEANFQVIGGPMVEGRCLSKNFAGRIICERLKLNGCLQEEVQLASVAFMPQLNDIQLILYFMGVYQKGVKLDVMEYFIEHEKELVNLSFSSIVFGIIDHQLQ